MKKTKIKKTDSITPEPEAPKALAVVKENSFLFGSIELEKINEQNDPLVPKEALEVILPINDKDAIALGIKENLPVLLIGETGVAKTSAVRRLAYLRQQPYVRVNMHGFSTPDELIGSKSVRATDKGNETYYEHGVITNAMQRGAILVIDEINATTPDCLFILHGLLDEDRRITLPNGEVIYPHPNFRVFATCNPDYEGTKSMNKAFLDRFPIIISVDTLAPDKEKELLVSRTKISEEMANILVITATMARKDYLEQKIFLYVSTRSLLNTAKLISSGMKPQNAWSTTVVKKTNNKDEQKALLDFFLAINKQAEAEDKGTTPIITTKKEFETLKHRAEKAEGLILDKERELATQLKAIDELEKTLEKLNLTADEIKKVIEGQKTEIEAERKKNEELQDQIKEYQQIEKIIQKASKKITTSNKKTSNPTQKKSL